MYNCGAVRNIEVKEARNTNSEQSILEIALVKLDFLKIEFTF